VELTGYASFSSFERAGNVERRLAGRYLSRWDDLLRLEKAGVRPLLAQADVTDAWRSTMDSTVLAVSWQVHPGLEVVLLLLDDEEFGREIKWLFSEGAMKRVDFKFLVVFVEQSMELLLAPGLEEILGGGEREITDGSDREPVVLRSNLFCYAFPSDGLVPEELGSRAGELTASRFAGIAVDDPRLVAGVRDRGAEPLLCFDVMRGVRACLARAGEGRVVLYLDNAAVAGSTAASAVLSIVRVQTQVLCLMLDG